MASSELWFTDRSRYMRGFECRWKRLLEYHAFDGGLRGKWLSAPLATGRYTHAVLERLLKKVQADPKIELGMEEVNKVLVLTLSDYRDEVEKSRGLIGEEKLDSQLDLVTGMSHGYARTVIPFVQRNFRIESIEQEYNYRLPLGPYNAHNSSADAKANPPSNIIWMLRPDFVAQSWVDFPTAAAGALSVHDFKSTSYWNEEEGPKQWADSVQMMANAYGTAAATGLSVQSYYMHMLVKGNKKYPGILTHAFYRPGNPPFNKEEWVANYTRAKAFSRVRIADYRSLPEWIWEVDPKLLSQKFPLVGPYQVYPYTVGMFFNGVVAEETWWQERMAGLSGVVWEEDWPKMSFQSHLDNTFPRTFACHDFSGHKCQFYELCHKDSEDWKRPLNGGNYQRRIPHHTQEGDQNVALNEIPPKNEGG